MKKEGGISRRSFCGGVAVTLMLSGLNLGSDGREVITTKGKPAFLESGRIEYVSDIWDAGDRVIGIDGFNRRGYWSFYMNNETGETEQVMFLDYTEVPFLRREFFSGGKTLSQHLDEGMNWNEVARLYYEGLSSRYQQHQIFR